MYIRDSFHSVEAVELESATGEPLSEGAVAWVVLVRHLVVHWYFAAYIMYCYTVVHIVGAVDRRPHVEPMLRVFDCCARRNWKLSGLHEGLLYVHALCL